MSTLLFVRFWNVSREMHKFTLVLHIPGICLQKEHRRSTMGKQKRGTQQTTVTVIGEDELGPMCDHVAIRYGRSVVVFAGYENQINSQKRIVRNERSLHNIYVYNLDSEQWRKFTIPDSEPAPCMYLDTLRRVAAKGCAVVIRNDIYFYIRDMWKLTKSSRNNFTWTKIDVERNKPIYRDFPGCWEFDEKMYLFSGLWAHKTGPAFICFDPTSQAWMNVESFGEIPSCRIGCGAEKIGTKVYLYGGKETFSFDDLYVCDMINLTWTLLYPAGQLQPMARAFHTFTSVSDTEIILHGGYFVENNNDFSDTWILDLTSLLWKECSQEEDEKRSRHSATNINGSHIIIGGLGPNLWIYSDVHHITYSYEPKTLEQMTLQVIHKYKDLLKPTDSSIPEDLYERFCDMSVKPVNNDCYNAYLELYDGIKKFSLESMFN